MNLKGNNLDDVTTKIVDAILDEPILKKEVILPRVRIILKAWVNANDRPVNYNDIKTEKGQLQRTIEKRGLEKEYWRRKLKEITPVEKMETYYAEINKILKDNGF